MRTDARHRVTASAVWTPAAGLTIAPIFRYRSKTPYNAITGVDDNRDGFNFDLPAGLRAHQLPARLGLHAGRHARLQEVPDRRERGLRAHRRGFNILNDTNPGTFVENMTSDQFGEPTTFAGDFGQSEQRLFQFGVALRVLTFVRSRLANRPVAAQLPRAVFISRL